MRSSHTPGATFATFDDSNLVSHGGLVPLMRLAEHVRLGELAGEWLKIPGSAGANAGAKVASIVAGMVVGADSIDDLDVLRHGATGVLFSGIRAPSTLGTFLRAMCWGDVSSLEAVARRVLVGLTERVDLLPSADQLAFLDVDSKVTRVYGPGKQGRAVGYTGVAGLHFQASTVCTADAAPVIVWTRLRSGNADSGRGAASLLATDLATARRCGATGTLIVRGDSKFYQGAVIAAIRRANARFSITAPMNSSVRAAIATITDTAWKKIVYGRPVYDEDLGVWVSEAEVAEVSYTAFTNVTVNPGQKVTARLLVRRVPVTSGRGDQGELFVTYRYQAVFTDSLFDVVTAEACHRDRAGAIEAVFAELNSSGLAHFPSGKFTANAAWLTLAGIAHNLTRAAGCLAGGRYGKARVATVRRRFVAVATRVSRTARTLTLHLPAGWPDEAHWRRLFTLTHDPPWA
jgi:hypothetical protein